MAQSRKPTPKTQQELSNTYAGQNAILGDPNLANPNFNGPNRSLQQTWTDDNVKPFTIGLEDIDDAIMYYFKNVIKPSVIQNGQRFEVPVIYGAPERWKSVQKDGYFKDVSGAIMSPLIMFKRNTVTKNRSVTNKLDANYPNLYAVMKKKYDTRNFYSNFNVLNNRIPEEQFYAVTVPDYLTINYSCIIQTYYIEQLNKIVEAIEYASDAYWGNPQRFQFKTMVDTFNSVTELTVGQERIVRSTFDMRMYGYIIPHTLQNDVASLKKYNNKCKIIFSVETDADPRIFIPDTQVKDLGTYEINQIDTAGNTKDPRPRI